jgi:hypothetical protein
MGKGAKVSKKDTKKNWKYEKEYVDGKQRRIKALYEDDGDSETEFVTLSDGRKYLYRK